MNYGIFFTGSVIMFIIGVMCEKSDWMSGGFILLCIGASLL